MTRHPADLVSLTFGLLFAAIGAVLLVGDLDLLSLDWIAPVAAIGIGLALILAARSSRQSAEDQPPAASG